MREHVAGKTSMEILLVNPPTLSRTKTLSDLGPQRPGTPYYQELIANTQGYSSLSGEHLGLQSLQASLQANGHHAEIINACVEMDATLAKTLERIESYDFDLVGFTGPLEVLAENVWLARSLREAGYGGHVTMGHDFATLNHAEVIGLFPEFDSVVRGEGEITISALASALEENRPVDEVAGLTYRDSGVVKVNPPRPVVKNLDTLPVVSRPDLSKVLSLGLSAGIFTRRGCPFRCTFCTTGSVPISEEITGPDTWRKRSPNHVVDEIETLISDYGIGSITIVDDLYLAKGTAGAQHALDIAHLLLDRQIKIDYMIDCRVDSVDRDVFRVLKASGLTKVFIGVESASPYALANYNKGYKPDIIRAKLQILEDLGIEFVLGYIFFSPLDTVEGLESSLRLIDDLDIRDFTLFTQQVRIYPGTPLYFDLRSRGLLRGRFPFFKARYPDAFVDKICHSMMAFEQLTSLVLNRALTDGESELTRSREGIYRLAVRLLDGLFDCSRRKDIDGMDRLFQEIRAELVSG